MAASYPPPEQTSHPIVRPKSRLPRAADILPGGPAFTPQPGVVPSVYPRQPAGVPSAYTSQTGGVPSAYNRPTGGAPSASTPQTGAPTQPLASAHVMGPIHRTPGPFPIGVTAVSVSVDASTVHSWAGADMDNIAVNIKGQGPYPFSFPRFNRGDLAPRISPRWPYSQLNLGMPAGRVGSHEEDPYSYATMAWRPSSQFGVVLASVAANGQKWDDGAPPFFGTVAVSLQSLGYGYSMVDGSYGPGECDVNMGKAGALGEANIDVGIAWFPYSDGWIAGHLAAPALAMSAYWQEGGAHSRRLPEAASSIVKWTSLGAFVRFPEELHVTSTTGMLFCISTDPSDNEINVVGVMHHSSGWLVQMREDNEGDATRLTDMHGWSFAFVFIPYGSRGRVRGGLVAGTGDGRLLHAWKGEEADALPMSSKRLEKGRYLISLGGSPRGSRGGYSDGVALLQPVGPLSSDVGVHATDGGTLTTNAFLSYNHSEEGDIIVEARRVAVMGTGSQRAETFPLVDTDFYFAWVRFQPPMVDEAAESRGGAATPSRLGIHLIAIGLLSTLVAVVWVIVKYGMGGTGVPPGTRGGSEGVRQVLDMDELTDDLQESLLVPPLEVSVNPTEQEQPPVEEEAERPHEALSSPQKQPLSQKQSQPPPSA
eukprot:jgi/Mesvir1/17319/Mv07713-RA.2